MKTWELVYWYLTSDLRVAGFSKASNDNVPAQNTV